MSEGNASIIGTWVDEDKRVTFIIEGTADRIKEMRLVIKVNAGNEEYVVRIPLMWFIVRISRSVYWARELSRIMSLGALIIETTE